MACEAAGWNRPSLKPMTAFDLLELRLFTPFQSDKRKHAYLIQRRADGADIQWVDGIYLELVSHQGASPGS